MLTQIFWTVTIVEFVALCVVVVLIFSGTWSSGPEGPVGAWLLFLPVLGFVAAWISYFISPQFAIKAFLAIHALLALGLGMEGWDALRGSYRQHYVRPGDDDFRGDARATNIQSNALKLFRVARDQDDITTF